MTSTDHTTTSTPLATSPRSDPTSFEIIDSPLLDVAQPGVPTDVSAGFEEDSQVQGVVPDATQNDIPVAGDANVDAAIPVQIRLREPSVVNAIAARARALLVKDFASMRRAACPKPNASSPQTNLVLTGLTVRATTHDMLSSSSHISDVISRIAHHPALVALALHPETDPGARAFAHVLMHSAEGEELARKAAEMHVARLRDWLASRTAEGLSACARIATGARDVWEQNNGWIPSVALGGSAVALFIALDSR